MTDGERKSNSGPSPWLATIHRRYRREMAFVFIKLEGSGGGFAKVDVRDGDFFADLAKRASAELCWGVPADHIDLFLVERKGDDRPTPADIAAAVSTPPLHETWKVAARVASGACLVARVSVPSAAGATAD